jgi:DNA polymerase III delta prime subunit
MNNNFVNGISLISKVIQARLDIHFNRKNDIAVFSPDFIIDESKLSVFLKDCAPTFVEFIVIFLALTPHLQPDLFTEIIKEYLPEGGDFPAFGGVKGTNHRGILPTGETAQFVLAGSDLAKRLEVQQLFASNHWFAQKGILWLETVREGEPAMSGRLILDAEWVELMTTGKVTVPRFGAHFPAERLQTGLVWDDLILPATTLQQIKEIETWIKHHRTLLDDWEMRHRIKPGYRALFHGPPGTGKTLTANLLGKYTGKEVYRVDLSLVVSKFIGETEKNLSALFEKARNKDWILFFDEADALFGKRTDVRDAHDKYANQEVSYLLQKIEDFPGVSILATNFKANIDDAFVRRFQSLVYFSLPKPAERLTIWQRNLPKAVQLDQSINLEHIANRYELSGSNIVNIIEYCCLQALAANTKIISAANLLTGVQRELLKENKTI